MKFTKLILCAKIIYMDEEIKQEFKKTNEKIDNLAGAVQTGFLEVGKRFDKVEGRLDKVEGRLDKVEGRLDKVEGGLSQVKTELSDFKMTVKNQYPDKMYLDNKLADLAAEIGRRIERNKEKEMKFKRKIIEIFKRNSLVTDDESQKLEELL